MSDWFIILLLPLAAWSGWWVAMRKEARNLRADRSRAAYFEGVGFLLNDQTDRAVDAFIHMADLDQQALDNQLTLGSLFRKRGELDRALHLHRQLYHHSNLEQNQRLAVLYELAEDYAAAGMYTQAQTFFEQLLLHESYEKSVILPLVRICERTGQWETAIELSKRWQQKGFGMRNKEIAHYYCELAQQCVNNTDEQNMMAGQYLQQALRADRGCIRAHKLQGQRLLGQAEYINAIHSLQSVGDYTLALLPDVLPALAQAYTALNRSEEYLQWLEDIEAKEVNVRLTLALVSLLAEHSKEKALALLQKRLEQNHSPLLLAAYLQHKSDLQTLYALIGQFIAPNTVYQCDECGFRQQRLIWHCPSCFAWSSFRPVIELKVEQR